MKRFILSGLSMILFSAIAAPVQAQPADSSNQRTVAGVAPFNLVSLANQGYFQDEGIPKYSRLMAAYRNGQVTSENIIQAAIDTGRLSEEKLDDSGYRLAVQYQLDNLYGNINN
jgi:hypothetical protein